MSDDKEAEDKLIETITELNLYLLYKLNRILHLKQCKNLHEFN